MKAKHLDRLGLWFESRHWVTQSQPAKALVRAVVNLGRAWGEEEGEPAMTPSCLQQGGGRTACLFHLPLQSFRIGGGSWDPRNCCSVKVVGYAGLNFCQRDYALWHWDQPPAAAAAAVKLTYGSQRSLPFASCG